MADLLYEDRLLINGELVPATGGRTYANINPATEEVLGQVADAGPEDIAELGAHGGTSSGVAVP